MSEPRVLPNPNDVQPRWDTEINQPEVEPLTAGKFSTDNVHPERLTRAANVPQGMLSSGNTDISQLPADTTFTSYESADGKETLIPVPKGFTPAQAITLHQSDANHPHLGVYDSPENARAAAEAIKLVPRGKSGTPVYIAPTLHPKAGRMPLSRESGHDVIQFNTVNGTHHIAIPAELPQELKNSISADIHKILSNMPSKE
jgi:hypothetical protein